MAVPHTSTGTPAPQAAPFTAASTILAETADDGAVLLETVSSGGFRAGDSIFIGDVGGTNETAIIQSIAGDDISIESPLENTHVAGTRVSRSSDEIADARGPSDTLREAIARGEFYVGLPSGGDDTAAIQAAIDAASATGGGKVVLARGSYQFSQIRMKTRVALVGASWETELVQAAGSNTNAIVLDTTSTILTMLSSFALFGNKAGQTSGDGINYQNAGGSFWFGDAVHFIDNLFISDIKEDGLSLDLEAREARVTGVYINGADGVGYRIDCTDSVFIGCTTASAGLQGWRIGGNNNRFIGCKAFGSGQEVGSSGDGFYIAASRQTLASCESQDNYRHGYVLASASECALTACVADSNGTGMFGVGFRLDGAPHNIIDGIAYNRSGTTPQQHGVELTTLAQHNVITLKARNNVGRPVVGGNGNNIRVNGSNGGYTTPGFSSSWTPDPYLAETQLVTLSGNITVNAPSPTPYIGQRLTLMFQQDGTGGRSISLNSTFKTNWTPTTTAFHRNNITFVWSGAHWVQINAATGVAP